MQIPVGKQKGGIFMELLREEFKKLSKFAVLLVIPWLILFNLLLCWLDTAFAATPAPIYLLFYVFIIAVLFSLGYLCGKGAVLFRHWSLAVCNISSTICFPSCPFPWDWNIPGNGVMSCYLCHP